MSEGAVTGLAPQVPLAATGARGVLPAQQLREALAAGWLQADPWQIPASSVQPASIDLRLGEHAWALRCSFLPDSDSTVEEKIEELAFERIDLRDGATLERDRPYLVPLIERLALPSEIRAKANPKSSTGRLDVFTRVLSDRSHRFDEVAAGYHGTLYLEVVPRTFAIRVRTGLALNQIRLMAGEGRLDDAEVLELHARTPLLFLDGKPLAGDEVSVSDGLFLSLDVSGDGETIVGYRARKNSLPIDLTGTETLALARLLGAGPPRARWADRARARDLLPAAFRGGGQHSPHPRRRDARLRPHRRGAANPLRRLLRSRLRLLPRGS